MGVLFEQQYASLFKKRLTVCFSGMLLKLSEQIPIYCTENPYAFYLVTLPFGIRSTLNKYHTEA